MGAAHFSMTGSPMGHLASIKGPRGLLEQEEQSSPLGRLGRSNLPVQPVLHNIFHFRRSIAQQHPRISHRDGFQILTVFLLSLREVIISIFLFKCSNFSCPLPTQPAPEHLEEEPRTEDLRGSPHQASSKMPWCTCTSPWHSGTHGKK